VGKNVISSI